MRAPGDHRKHRFFGISSLLQAALNLIEIKVNGMAVNRHREHGVSFRVSGLELESLRLAGQSLQSGPRRVGDFSRAAAFNAVGRLLNTGAFKISPPYIFRIT